MSKHQYVSALSSRTRRARTAAVVVLVTFALVATAMTVISLANRSAQPAAQTATDDSFQLSGRAQVALSSVGTQLGELNAALQAWDALPAQMRDTADPALKPEIDRRHTVLENIRAALTTALANPDAAARGEMLRQLLAAVQGTAWSPANGVLRDTVLALATSAPAKPPTMGVPVHRGDTLWCFARLYRTTVAHLQDLNGLGGSTLIRAGSTLHVPATAAEPLTSTSNALSAPTTSKVRPAPALPRQKAAPRPRTATGSGGGGDGGSLRAIAAKIFGDQVACASSIISRESGWKVNAANAKSGAYGLPQALPATKMASAGPNWRGDAETQLRWMYGYVNDRYGGACRAWAYWQAHHNY